MTHGQQIGTSQRFPAEAFYGQHLTQFAGRERQEGFKNDGQVGGYLEAEIQNATHPGQICFGQFPGFGVGQVFIADAGQIHGFFLGISKAEYIEQGFDLVLDVGKLLHCLPVVIVKFAPSRYFPLKILMSEYHSPVDKVAEYGYQFVVVAGLKIFPGKIIVLGFGGVGS